MTTMPLRLRSCVGLLAVLGVLLHATVGFEMRNMTFSQVSKGFDPVWLLSAMRKVRTFEFCTDLPTVTAATYPPSQLS
jgi:hypothetical protein